MHRHQADRHGEVGVALGQLEKRTAPIGRVNRREEIVDGGLGPRIGLPEKTDQIDNNSAVRVVIGIACFRPALQI